MDFPDAVELGAGVAFGGILAHSVSNAFTDALDARSSMQALTIPQTRAEIQTLFDRLDVGLANGHISEPTYKTLVAKWTARLHALETPAP